MDDPLPDHAIDGPSLGLRAQAQAVDLLPGRQGTALQPDRERDPLALAVRRAGTVVIAPFGSEGGIELRHRRAGVGADPVPPGRDRHRHQLEADRGFRHPADDRLAGELAPQRPGLAVDHQLVAAVEQPGGAEGPGSSRGRAARVGDRGVAEGAEAERDRLAADRVVHHLVPAQVARRPGMVRAPRAHPEDGLAAGEEPGLRRGDPRRVFERRNAVDRHPSPDDLFEGDAGWSAAVEDLAISRIDPRQERRLPFHVPRAAPEIAPPADELDPVMVAGPRVFARECPQDVEERTALRRGSEEEGVDQGGHQREVPGGRQPLRRLLLLPGLAGHQRPDEGVALLRWEGGDSGSAAEGGQADQSDQSDRSHRSPPFRGGYGQTTGNRCLPPYDANRPSTSTGPRRLSKVSTGVPASGLKLTISSQTRASLSPKMVTRSPARAMRIAWRTPSSSV